MDAPETLPVFYPLVIRELGFFLMLEGRLSSILEEEARHDLNICTEHVEELLSVCSAAQVRIAQAINASAGADHD